MFKKIMMAGLAVGALALGAPIAHADAPTFDCGFNSVQQADATGQNYEGAVYGYVVDADASAVTIDCYITVNGAKIEPGVTGSGTVAATAQGRVTFAAADTDDVKLVAVATVTHGGVTTTYTSSGDSTHTQIPPQEVIDALDSVFDIIADATAGTDPLICGVLKTAGVPALVNSTTAVTTLSLDTDDCDIYLGGEQLIDFVPYGA